MRHTRNRQMVKLGHKNFKYLASNKISLMRKVGYKFYGKGAKNHERTN